MTAEIKIAQGKLTLLQLAEKLKNISEACRRKQISRSQFYEYKRAFQEQGFQGLIDHLPIPKVFPNATPHQIKERILAVSMEHPAWGKTRITDQLKQEGILLSSTTVRNVLLREGLETKYKRILRLEETRWGTDTDLTEEQVRFIEKTNPCFRERKVESYYPGYLLCQDTFTVGTLKGIGRVYLQAVIDTYGSYAFGKLYTSKGSETAADVLYDRVLPFYEDQGIRVEHILTDNGTEYCGRFMTHPYEIFLELNEIKHRRTRVATPRTNGFVERFNRTILDEFFREVFRKKFFASIEEIQQDLDVWLAYYNQDRPHRGYRNMGRRPVETFNNGKKVREDMMKSVA
jgi:transposase InsO family protein